MIRIRVVGSSRRPSEPAWWLNAALHKETLMVRTSTPPADTHLMSRGVAAAMIMAGITVLAPGRLALAQSLTVLGFLPGHNNSMGAAISADGSVVVGVSGVNGQFDHTYRWTSAGGMVDIAPSAHYLAANGVSPD